MFYVNIKVCVCNIILKNLNILKINLYNINIYFELSSRDSISGLIIFISYILSIKSKKYIYI